MNRTGMSPYRSWMITAVKEIIAADPDQIFRDIRNDLESTVGRNSETDRKARELTARRLAEHISNHCPRPKVFDDDPASLPIRRGDVVQVDPEKSGGRCRTRIWVLIDVDEYGFGKTGFSPDVPLSYCTRIGRAAYYPDGTKVED